MNHAPSVQLIAVVGGSGAGKTWLVQRLCRLLGENARHLLLDAFYRDCSHLPLTQRGRLNFDVPGAIDWKSVERVLRDCRDGEPTSVPQYDFPTHCRTAERTTFLPRPIVFVDGLWLLRSRTLRQSFDLKLYVDTPAQVRCRRRLARDVIERGYAPTAIERQLRTNVLPMHRRYVEPQKRWADLVLAQPFRGHEISALTERLWAMLSRVGLVQPWARETFQAELFALLHETVTGSRAGQDVSIEPPAKKNFPEPSVPHCAMSLR